MAVELKKPYYIVLLYIIVIIALDSLPGALKWYEIMNVWKFCKDIHFLKKGKNTNVDKK